MKITEQTPFFRMPGLVMSNKVLKDSEKVLLTALISFARGKNYCFPSYTTLEQTTGQSHSTVIRGIKKLEEYGILAKMKKEHNKTKSNKYFLFLDAEIFKQDTAEKMKAVAKEYNWTMNIKKELASSRQTKTQVHNSSSL